MNHDDNDTIGNLDTIGSFPTQPEPERPAGPARAAPAETIGGLETQSEDGRIVLAGRYAVVKRLGEGGMGSVWLAEDRKLDGRKVAIKMLPAVLAGKKGAYKQVKAEALMAMKLSHPNIATVRAFEEDENRNPFLVMDYVEGQGLDDILSDKGTLSEEETVKLLAPVAAALDYAHAKGVVHRDVKPGNVMVDRNGTPFVLDFGIAREVQETMTRVTGKLSSGTLLYMSPEQLNGDKPRVAQDVYSFAAMAYECLSGEPPFARGQIEWQIMNKAPEPLPDGVGEALRCGIMAGLAKDPKDRPTSCAGVLGLDEAEKREREKRVAEEARRLREEELARARQREAEEAQRRWETENARAREQAAYEERRREEALEAEREARKVAEARMRKAQEEAARRAAEAMQAEEAKGRATGWVVALVIAMVVAGIVVHALWEGKKEELRKARQESEAKWKAEPEAQQKAQAEAERKAKEEARQKLERQRAEAEAKADQERQMKPSILLKATVNGREVNATVTEGLAQHGLKTPVTVNLESGGNYNFAVEYESGGKKYAGRKTVNAKDRGVTEATVALEEMKEAAAGTVKSIDLGNGVKLEMVSCPGVARDFWMGKYEVTQEQWRQVTGNSPSHFGGKPKNPVENISWNDCHDFIQKLNAMPAARASGLTFRLPTEEEWETACRAGAPKSADYCKLADGTQITAGTLSRVAWFNEDWNTGSTHPVGTKTPNAWGLYDMHGNVWEWTETGDGDYRVLRGGCFNGGAGACTAGGRSRGYPGGASGLLGFRLAASGRAATR